MIMLTISPIRAFSDNYIWLIVRNNQAFVVDPGEPGPVLAALEAAAIELSGILVTHHHYDHTGAVEALKTKTGCEVWGPPDSPAGPYDRIVAEGDTVSVLGVDFSVLNVPGHTLDHIAYYCAAEQALFCAIPCSWAAAGAYSRARLPKCGNRWKNCVAYPRRP